MDINFLANFDHCPDFEGPIYPREDLHKYQTAHSRKTFSDILFSSSEEVSDRTLLENLLYLVCPDCDVERISSVLLSNFKTFSAITAAPMPRLLEVSGIPITAASALKLVRSAALRLKKTTIENIPLIEKWENVIEYLVALLRYETKEQFRILFLNAYFHLISDELIAEGTINYVAVHIREIVRRVFELNAVAIVLVHNHPSGQLMPSHEDLKLTQKILDVCEAINVTLYEHIIIADGTSINILKSGVIRKSQI